MKSHSPISLVNARLLMTHGTAFYAIILVNTWFNIGIKHGIPCINVCQVPREMLKTEAYGLGFQHLPRDRANVNVLENHV